MRDPLKMILPCLLLLLSAIVAFSQQAEFQALKDTTAFKQKLKIITSKTLTIQSEFEQEKSISVLDEKIITTGKFAFQSPNSLRWEYLDPFEYLIVFNQKNVTIKDGERVSRYNIDANKAFREINDLMIEIVQGDVVNHQKYHITYYDNGIYFCLHLSPKLKAMQQFLQVIQIQFDRSDVEKSGDYTSIAFREKKINEAVTDKLFMVD